MAKEKPEIPEKKERMELVGKEVLTQIDGLFATYREKIEETFQNVPTKDGLAIGFAVKIKGSEPMMVETTISFTESKIKDSIVKEVYVQQGDMF